MEAAGWANVIASFAFVVSLVAAAFSWRSAVEAKRANRIGAHHYQQELYAALTSVRKLIVKRGPVTSEAELLPYSDKIRSARLYVSPDTYKRLVGFFDMCLGIEQLHTDLESARDYVRLLSDSYAGETLDVSQKQTDAAHARVDKAREVLRRRVEIVTAIGNKLDTDLSDEIRLI
jgi:hypothetical protein